MREAASEAVGYVVDHDRIMTALEACQWIIHPEERLEEVETYLRLHDEESQELLDEADDLRIVIAIRNFKQSHSPACR